MSVAEEVWRSRVGRRGKSMGPYLSSKGALWHLVGRRKYRSGQGLAVATPWVPDVPWGKGASNLVFLAFIRHLLMASDTPWNLTEG